MIEIAEIKRGALVEPGRVTGECSIKLNGPSREIYEVVQKIEELVKQHNLT